LFSYPLSFLFTFFFLAFYRGAARRIPIDGIDLIGKYPGMAALDAPADLFIQIHLGHGRKGTRELPNVGSHRAAVKGSGDHAPIKLNVECQGRASVVEYDQHFLAVGRAEGDIWEIAEYI